MSDRQQSEQPGFLARLEPDENAALRATARRRQYPKGTTLFNEGESSDRVVIVIEGRVKISYFTDEGKEVVLAIRGPNEILGEFSAIDGEPRSATATAMEPTEALVLGAEDFRTYLEQSPKASFALLQMLVSRVRDADHKRIEFAAYDSVGRVARRLVELAERFGEQVEGGGVRIDLPLSQDELAGWTGSSREAVSKALQHLRSRGWIETGRRTITVTDVDALRKRAT
jgi:CRP-like cAMP-binding protein